MEDMKTKELRALKKGEFFTKKAIEYPSDMQVFVKGDYDRETKSFWCHKFGDVNSGCLVKANKIVYTEFTF